MSYLRGDIVKRLTEKQEQLAKLRPIPTPALRKLREAMRLDMTHNSNAIEGNSLTLKETFLVVNEGFTVKGKPLKDHLEAKDQYDALGYLYELVDGKKDLHITETLIRQLHELVVKATDEEWAGTYRTSHVVIAGSSHTPPEPIYVPQKMRSLVQWIKRHQSEMHPVELAALTHHRFVHIHPFFDGNGRTARLLMNVVLMRAGYPLSIILKQDRKKYYHVLEKADHEEYEPYVLFIAQAVERSLNLYLRTLSTSGTKQEQLFLLSELAPHTPYSAKYLNLLARSGRLEAVKQGRNWVASREAVDRYVAGRERMRNV